MFSSARIPLQKLPEIHFDLLTTALFVSFWQFMTCFAIHMPWNQCCVAAPLGNDIIEMTVVCNQCRCEQRGPAQKQNELGLHHFPSAKNCRPFGECARSI